MFFWINYFTLICYGFLDKVQVNNVDNSVRILIQNSSFIVPVLFFLKKHSKFLFSSLIDITAVDYLGLQKKITCNQRFKIVYVLLSHYFATKIIIECFVDDMDNLPSSSDVYKSAPWLEREIWDMFGLFFTNHPDLRRILTDYGFEGFPLRKDFPITGYSEIRYDDTQKCLVYEPLELSQEYRIFDSLSPWIAIS